MTTPFDGDATPEQQDRLLHQLQEQQQRGCNRARRLLKDYRDFFKSVQGQPNGIMFRGGRPQTDEA